MHFYLLSGLHGITLRCSSSHTIFSIRSCRNTICHHQYGLKSRHCIWQYKTWKFSYLKSLFACRYNLRCWQIEASSAAQLDRVHPFDTGVLGPIVASSGGSIWTIKNEGGCDGCKLTKRGAIFYCISGVVYSCKCRCHLLGQGKLKMIFYLRIVDNWITRSL